MTDSVFPSVPPKLNPPPSLVAKTIQPSNPTRPRPVYHPKPNRSCTGRRCCCLCFLYTLISLLTLFVLASTAACILNALYHPKHPTFSVTALRTTRFNVTRLDLNGFTRVDSRVDLTIAAKNPNKGKIAFVYGPFTLTLAAAGVPCGNVSAAGFGHGPGNTTFLRVALHSDASRELDLDSTNELESSLKKKAGFPVTVELETTVVVKVGKLRTKNVGLRVTCRGLKAFQPKNSTSSVGVVGVTAKSKCKVDLRIKIWKFTF